MFKKIVNLDIRSFGVAVIFCALLFISSIANADTLGTTTVGGFTGVTSRVACNPYTATSTGRVSSMSWYVTGSGSIGTAIYSDSAGAPTTLLASSYNIVAVSSAGWYTVNIAYTLTSGTTYWLCGWGDSSPTYYFANGSTSKVSDTQAAFSWPQPYTTNATGARLMSLYATFVPYNQVGNATVNNAVIR